MSDICKTNSRKWARFCGAFWPALWSGLISSLVTGIVVGAVVYKINKYFDHEQAVEGYKRELSQLKFNIVFAMTRPGNFRWQSAVESTPPESAALMQLLGVYQLSVWQASLPDEKDFFNQMATFQAQYMMFQNTAADLDQELVQFVRRYSDQHKLSRDDDELIKKYIFAKLQDIDDKLFFRFEEIGKLKIEVLQDALAEAKIDRLLSGAHGRYKESRDLLLKTQSAIKIQYLR